MSAAATTKEGAYNLDPIFEKAVVFLACSNPRFYGRIGHTLDPELFRYASSTWAIKAAHAIFKDVGRGPDRSVLVIQRLRAWMGDGKVKLEEIKKVCELFDAAEDAGLPDVENVIAELTPLIQQRLRDQAIQTGIEAFGQKRDLSKVIELENKAARIGQVDTSIGTIFGQGSWAEVDAFQRIERMPTGIVELDSGIGGGLERGGLGMLIGGFGDGKSMGLSHIAAFNVMQGAFCGYATLELPRAEVLARFKAFFAGHTINEVKAGSVGAKRAIDKLAGQLGPLVVRDFPPLTTTVDDIKEWVKASEDHLGRKMDLLVVDYADKVGVKSGKKKDDESGYSTGRVVYEGIRIWSHDEQRFSWTASQATRRKDRKKKLDGDDVADSMHKIRVVDLAVSLNVTEDELTRMIKFFVAKHRTGESRFDVGPFPTAFELGRLVA